MEAAASLPRLDCRRARAQTAPGPEAGFAQDPLKIGISLLAQSYPRRQNLRGHRIGAI